MPRVAAFLLLAASLFAQSGAELLAKVDKLRHPWPSFSVEVSIEDRGTVHRWRVLARSNGDARVEGLSDKEKGRVVLLLGEQMWLLLPNARKPIKVTPQQRLLGPAAGGDIARSSFGEDYEVIEKTENRLENALCWRLELQAKKPSISFRKATLWVDASNSRPLKAEYFLASGKLSKIVTFPTPVAVHGKLALPGMTLEEPGGKKAELRFGHWAPGTHDPELFQLPAAK